MWHITAYPKAELTFHTPKSALGDTLQPVSVSAKIIPDGILTIEPGQSVQRTVVLPVSKVDYKPNAKLGPILEQLFKGSAAYGSGVLTVHMNYESFELSKPVIKDWDNQRDASRLGDDDPEIQGKIYRLNDVAKDIARRPYPARSRSRSGSPASRLRLYGRSTLS